MPFGEIGERLSSLFSGRKEDTSKEESEQDIINRIAGLDIHISNIESNRPGGFESALGSAQIAHNNVIESFKRKRRALFESLPKEAQDQVNQKSERQTVGT